MKSGLVAVALAGVIVIAGIGYAFLNESNASAQAQETNGDTKVKGNQAGAVVQVDDLAEKPDDYKGRIVLKAAVARVSKSQGVFAAIDYREFLKCHELDCAKHYLPVKFSGEIPKPETLIQMTGQVVKGEKGLIFEAKTMEVIK